MSEYILIESIFWSNDILLYYRKMINSFVRINSLQVFYNFDPTSNFKSIPEL